MVQLEPCCETAGCYHRLVRCKCSGEIGDECTGFYVLFIIVYFILCYFILLGSWHLCFVVKQSWHCCLLLLAELLLCPDYLSQGWVALDGAALLLPEPGY